MGAIISSSLYADIAAMLAVSLKYFPSSYHNFCYCSNYCYCSTSLITALSLSTLSQLLRTL